MCCAATSDLPPLSPTPPKKERVWFLEPKKKQEKKKRLTCVPGIRTILKDSAREDKKETSNRTEDRTQNHLGESSTTVNEIS